jgi:hypothetical protein
MMASDLEATRTERHGTIMAPADRGQGFFRFARLTALRRRQRRRTCEPWRNSCPAGHAVLAAEPKHSPCSCRECCRPQSTSASDRRTSDNRAQRRRLSATPEIGTAPLLAWSAPGGWSNTGLPLRGPPPGQSSHSPGGNGGRPQRRQISRRRCTARALKTASAQTGCQPQTAVGRHWGWRAGPSSCRACCRHPRGFGPTG